MIERILVLRGGALGDFLVTLPALGLLRTRWPAARIELAGNARAADLGILGGYLDAVHSQDESRWSGLFAHAPLPSAFAGWLGEFDLVVNYWPDSDRALARRFPIRPGQSYLAASARPAVAPAARHFCEPLLALGLGTDDFRSRLPTPYSSNNLCLHSWTTMTSGDQRRSLLARSTGASVRQAQDDPERESNGSGPRAFRGACRGAGDSRIGIASRLAPAICTETAESGATFGCGISPGMGPPGFIPAGLAVTNVVSPPAPVAIHPGSGSPAKNWPDERWLELVAQLDGPFLLVLGEAERGRWSGPLLAALRSAARAPLEVADSLALPDLAAALARCGLFLGHDSGISHLAAALGLPCVLLFGPTEPAMWAPPGAHVRVIRRNARLDSIGVGDVVAMLPRTAIRS
jgi:hypothetical protein